ncbi:MAG TPA: FAD-dependent oxidoreductase [Chloroflexota bacterium]|nr:FAD-dependent oxidoreductase [Chloroflexota bacterium]
MEASSTYVIVGASLAGGRAAETLRAEGFAGHILLVGAEPDRPYERPPLSKQYLRREWSRDKVFLHPAEYYDQQHIELRLGQRVQRVATSEKRVALATGTPIAYDKLLIATGASPRRLHVPGGNLEGVEYLRTLRDADTLGATLKHTPRVLIVGASFIGSEVAASARMLGCQVTMLEAAAVPLLHALGERMGAVYAGFHRDHGVDLRLGEGIAAFRGAGRLEEAVTTSGAHIPCDLAIVGIGVAPVVDFLEGSGLAVNNGITTDELCRASQPDVFAAGDVANWWHPGLRERLRVEHFDHADNQGKAAARSMLGRGEPYAPTLYFWSDQYDLSLEYAGHATRWDQIVLRGNPDQRSFCAFYLQEGHIKACLSVNRSADLAKAQGLIAGGRAVEARQLADEGTDLAQLGQPVGM